MQPKPWERYGAKQTAPADPTKPYEEPKARADLTGTELGNQGKVLDNQRDATELPWIVRENTGKMYDRFRNLREVQAYTDSLPFIDIGLNSTPNAAGDNQLVTAFVKITDDSMVTDQEREGAQGVAGLSAKLRQRLANFKNGDELPPESREKLRREIARIGQKRQRLYNLRREEFEGRAKRYGVDPIDVVGSHPAKAFIREDQTVEDWLVIPERPEDSDDFELSGSGKNFATEQDIKFHAKAQAAFDAGASFEELQKMAQADGREPFGMDLAEAIQFRDGGGKGAKLAIPESGKRSLIERGVGAVADSEIGAGVIGAANATTLGGLDEIAGLVGGESAANRVQAAKEYTRENFPLSSLAGEIGGSALSFGGAAGVASRIAPNLGKTSRGILSNVTTGALHGAGEDNENRGRGALLGGGAALAGDAAGRYVAAPLLRKAADTKLGQKAVGMFGGSVPNAPSKAEKLIAPINVSDGVEARLADAQRLNLPYSLADADPALRTVAGSATRKSADARRLAENTVEPRSLGQGERLQAAISNDLAPPVNLREAGDAIKHNARQAADPYYKAFEAEAPQNLSPELAGILNTPFGREASRRASEIAANSGREIAPNSPEMLDLIKKSMDDILEAQRNPVTRSLELDNAGVQQQGVRNRWRDGVTDLYPSYGAAREAYQHGIKPLSDMELGAKAVSNRVTPDELGQGLQNADRGAVQTGFASQLSDDVGKIGFSHNPYKRVFGTPNQREKIGQVFPEGVDNFARRFELEGDMAKTGYETLGGSPTALRMQADDGFDRMAGGIEKAVTAGADLMTGAPLASVAQQGFRSAAGDALRFGLGRRGEGLATEVAPVLFNQNPKEALEAYLKARAAVDARRQYNQMTGQVGGMFGAPIAITSTLPNY